MTRDWSDKMGEKFTIMIWTCRDRTEHQIKKGVPEYYYEQLWEGDDFDDAISELNGYRGKYECIKLECRG